jgi:hypothetical protein
VSWFVILLRHIVQLFNLEIDSTLEARGRKRVHGFHAGCLKAGWPDLDMIAEKT